MSSAVPATEGGKAQLWARMVDRVEQKFEERAMEAEAQVNEWWMAFVNAELAEVSKTFVRARPCCFAFLPPFLVFSSIGLLSFLTTIEPELLTYCPV